jgi:tRNA A-37 threonylcarbamoyl transferase component Bud32
LADVLAAPGRVIKESKAKLVSENQVGARSYFIKRYRHFAVPLRPWKYFFKAAQARQEWRLAMRMEQLGIPAVRHVALGERWSPLGLQESILITEAFDGLPANEVPDLRSRDIVEFVERMANAGVVQRDFHPANLLVRQAPFEIRLVDLHGIDFPHRRSAFERETNRDTMLAHLRMSLPLDVPRNVEWFSRELRQRALLRRSRRCLKSNRDFSVRRFGTWKWNARSADLVGQVEKILEDPDGFMESARPLKRGRSSTLAAGEGLVLKRYNFKKPLNALKDLFRGSRGRRGFRKAYHLELCGVTTPRVVATADQLNWGLPTRSYVLMREVPAAIDAGKWDQDPRCAARALAALLARLHDEGFTHRDLKETNLLFDAAGVPHLIDLDGVRFVSVFTESEARTDLERLARGLAPLGKLTRANTLTFLLAYCRQRKRRARQLFPRDARS